MTETEKVEFIIQHLGFNGATHTLRVSKERINRLRRGESFSVNAKKFANKTILNIIAISNGVPAPKEVTNLYYSKIGAKK